MNEEWLAVNFWKRSQLRKQGVAVPKFKPGVKPGYKRSEQTRARMKASAIKRWEKRRAEQC